MFSFIFAHREKPALPIIFLPWADRVGQAFVVTCLKSPISLVFKL